MYVEYGGCRDKGMHCGATAGVSSIWKHLLIISIILKPVINREQRELFLSCGDHRYPRFHGHSLVIAVSLIPSQWCSVGNMNRPIMLVINGTSSVNQWWTTGGRDHKPLFWWWTVISFSQSDALQPARSPLFSVSVNDDDQQAERSSRVLCQWTYGWNRYRPC
jgi:hypothetical protein